MHPTSLRPKPSHQREHLRQVCKTNHFSSVVSPSPVMSGFCSPSEGQVKHSLLQVRPRRNQHPSYFGLLVDLKDRDLVRAPQEVPTQPPCCKRGFHLSQDGKSSAAAALPGWASPSFPEHCSGLGLLPEIGLQQLRGFWFLYLSS